MCTQFYVTSPACLRLMGTNLEARLSELWLTPTLTGCDLEQVIRDTAAFPEGLEDQTQVSHSARTVGHAMRCAVITVPRHS